MVVKHGLLHWRGMQAKGIWKQDPEANIRTQEGCEWGLERLHNEVTKILFFVVEHPKTQYRNLALPTSYGVEKSNTSGSQEVANRGSNKKRLFLYCIDGVVIAAPNALLPFWDYCAPPNLGTTRTWICRLNFCLRSICSGLSFFNEPEIWDSEAPA